MELREKWNNKYGIYFLARLSNYIENESGINVTY